MNKERDFSLCIKGLAIAILLVVITGVLCSVSGMMTTHKLQSLAEAMPMLAYCMDEGNEDCHLELDGWDYNVYWIGE